LEAKQAGQVLLLKEVFLRTVFIEMLFSSCMLFSTVMANIDVMIPRFNWSRIHCIFCYALSV